jgi:hypothetical protein
MPGRAPCAITSLGVRGKSVVPICRQLRNKMPAQPRPLTVCSPVLACSSCHPGRRCNQGWHHGPTGDGCRRHNISRATGQPPVLVQAQKSTQLSTLLHTHHTESDPSQSPNLIDAGAPSNPQHDNAHVTDSTAARITMMAEPRSHTRGPLQTHREM